MYSISEVSKIIGVSRQSIYKKVNKEGLQEYLVNGEKGKVITEKGLSVLKKLFSEYLDSKPEDDNLQQKNCSPTDNLQGEFTTDYIASLKAEIHHLKGIISDQSQQTTSLTRLLENSQVLLKQQQDKIFLLEDSQGKEKTSFWDRFKRN